MAARTRILIVDDERYVRDSLVELLGIEGYTCHAAGSMPEALEQARSFSPAVVLTDLSMPSGSGIELLAALRQAGSHVPVVLMTGVGTVRDAVAAIQGGAYDFLQKPVDAEQLRLVLRRAVEYQELVREVRNLRESARSGGGRELVGSSAAIAAVRQLIDSVAQSDATVLVTGESGTGKELVAEQLHLRSARARKPLVRVNCAAIPSTLFESEFFGHRRGAFSGAVADRTGRFAEAEGGTIVLDEIGTLPGEMQAKLLRVLENGEYQVVGESRTRVSDARVIALTNEALAERVQKGEFRADLYYRLNVFPIALPPLRSHREDIPEIAAALLRSTHAGAGALGPGAAEVLASHDWPGNVRELRNVLERATIVGGRGPLDARLLRALIEPAIAGTAPTVGGGGDHFHLRHNLDALETQLLQRALEKCEGRKKDAAALLGIDARNMGYYLRKHGLSDLPPRA